MSLNWWNALPPWAQRLLAKIPSPVVEASSGLVTVALAVGIVAGVDHLGAWLARSALDPLGTPVGLVAVAFIAHFLSVFYEVFIDANGWELKDVLQREVGIVAGLAIWYWLV